MAGENVKYFNSLQMRGSSWRILGQNPALEHYPSQESLSWCDGGSDYHHGPFEAAFARGRVYSSTIKLSLFNDSMRSI